MRRPPAIEIMATTTQGSGCYFGFMEAARAVSLYRTHRTTALARVLLGSHSKVENAPHALAEMVSSILDYLVPVLDAMTEFADAALALGIGGSGKAQAEKSNCSTRLNSLRSATEPTSRNGSRSDEILVPPPGPLRRASASFLVMLEGTAMRLAPAPENRVQEVVHVSEYRGYHDGQRRCVLR